MRSLKAGMKNLTSCLKKFAVMRSETWRCRRNLSR